MARCFDPRSTEHRSGERSQKLSLTNEDKEWVVQTMRSITKDERQQNESFIAAAIKRAEENLNEWTLAQLANSTASANAR